MSDGFTIENISLQNFRNYTQHRQNFEAGINKIIGPNATGKTNLIEAIGLVTQIASFRHATTAELVNKSLENLPLKISADILDSHTNQKFEICLNIIDGKKTYTLNGKYKKISELKGRFPSVIFNPDDLALCKGSNTMRRDAVDNLGTQISADYYAVLRDYERALKQKNALLRDGSNLDMLKSINDVMLAPGVQLVFYRFALVHKLEPILHNYYSEIAGSDENLTIEYYASWAMDSKIESLSRDEAKQFLSQAFEAKINAEQASSRALIGPHRDRIVFVLNGSDSKSFASQGQQRSIVLSFKLAEVQMIEDALDRRPILLLDDVMSELDSFRREKLLNFVNKVTQSFITSC